MSDARPFDVRLRVMLITPEISERPDWLARTSEALAGGVRCVQLRAKNASARALMDAARTLRELTRAAGALFLVNGRVDVARAAAADGVHLGAAGLPAAAVRALLGAEAVIGYSAHLGEAPAAWRGASYCTFSPVYPSPGKGEAVGAAALQRFVAGADVPVVALGGVTAERMAEAAAAGASGAAVIREIFDAPDPAAAARRLCAAWEETQDHGSKNRS